MQCHQCHSAMQLTDSFLEGRVYQAWYQCPLCTAQQTIAHPCKTLLRRIGSMQRCSGNPLSDVHGYRGPQLT